MPEADQPYSMEVPYVASNVVKIWETSNNNDTIERTVEAYTVYDVVGEKVLSEVNEWDVEADHQEKLTDFAEEVGLNGLQDAVKYQSGLAVGEYREVSSKLLNCVAARGDVGVRLGFAIGTILGVGSVSTAWIYESDLDPGYGGVAIAATLGLTIIAGFFGNEKLISDFQDNKQNIDEYRQSVTKWARLNFLSQIAQGSRTNQAKQSEESTT